MGKGRVNMKIGFDPKKYLEEQSKFILERVNDYDKLYLEFGGKLLFDMHAKEYFQALMKMLKLSYFKNLKTS